VESYLPFLKGSVCGGPRAKAVTDNIRRGKGEMASSGHDTYEFSGADRKLSFSPI